MESGFLVREEILNPGSMTTEREWKEGNLTPITH